MWTKGNGKGALKGRPLAGKEWGGQGTEDLATRRRRPLALLTSTSIPLLLPSFSPCPSSQMWACALGHLEAAVLLFRWNRQALSIPDSLGRLPLSVAHSRGHVRLARCLEELQRQEASAEPPVAMSPPSSSPDTGEGCP